VLFVLEGDTKGEAADNDDTNRQLIPDEESERPSNSRTNIQQRPLGDVSSYRQPMIALEYG
jgi:hypothetical protein